MAKMTVLEIVQDILNDIDGDEVNSIDDTIESQQVAQIVKTTYQAMMSNRDWPHTRTLLKTVGSGDSALPTHMTFSDDIKRIISINYNKVRGGETRLKYLPVKYLDADDFLRISNNRNSDDSTIDTITDPTSVKLLIRNDIPPTYYTSFDDESIIFDSYDSAIENTLQSSKVQAMGYVIPVLTLTDTATPDLPDEAFVMLLEKAKSRSSLKLRQLQDVLAEKEANQQSSWLSRNMWRVNGGIGYTSYGRRKGRNKRFSQETNQ